MSDLKSKVSIILEVLNKGKGEIRKQANELKALDSSSRKASQSVDGAGKKVDRLGTVAGKASKNTGKLKDNVKNLNSNAKSLNNTLGDTIAKMTRWAAIGGSALFAVREAANFESAMADINKVMDLTQDESEALRKSIRKMSVESGQTAVEVAAIATAAGQLGVAKEDVLEFTRVVNMMSTAFDMTTADAGTAVGKIQNIFGLAIGELETFGNVINTLGNNMAAKEPEIINAIMRIGGSAKQFGLAENEAAALVTTLIAMGKPPEVAATAINSMLAKLQTAGDQGPKFQAALKAMGISADDLAKDIEKGPAEAIRNFLATLHEMEGQDRASALVGLFGTEFQDDIGIMVEGLGQYEKALGLVSDKYNVSGKIADEYADRLKTTNVEFNKAREAVKRIADTMAYHLLPALKVVLRFISSTATAIGDFAEKCPNLATGITAVGTALVGLAGTRITLGLLNKVLLLLGINLKGVTTAGTLLKGLDLAGWASSGIGLLGRLATAARGLWMALNPITKLMAVFAAGWAVGSWLNNFAVVRKAGLSLIYSMDRVRLAAKKMWKSITGQDTSGVDAEIKAAEQTFDEMLDKIDKGQDEYAKKKRAQAKEQAREAVKNAATEAPAKSQESVKAPGKKAAQEDYAKQAEADAKKTEQEAIDTWPDEWLTPEQLKERNEKKAKSPSPTPDDSKKSREYSDDDGTPPGMDPEEIFPSWGEESERKEKGAVKKANQAVLEEERKKKEEEAAIQEKAAKEEEEREKRKAEKRRQRNRRAAQEDEAIAKQLDGAARDSESENEKALEEFNAGVLKAAKARVEAERKASEEARSIYQQYADRVKSLQDEILGREQSLQDELNQLDSKGSKESRWQKQLKDAKEYEKAAKAAMKAGDLEKAQQLADKSRQAYSSLKGGAGKIGKDRADKMAYSGVKASGELGLSIARLLQQQTAKNAVSAGNRAGNLGVSMNAVKGQFSNVANKGGSKPQVEKVHELRFDGGSVQGQGNDIERLLDVLKQANRATG